MNGSVESREKAVYQCVVRCECICLRRSDEAARWANKGAAQYLRGNSPSLNKHRVSAGFRSVICLFSRYPSLKPRLEASLLKIHICDGTLMKERAPPTSRAPFQREKEPLRLD